MAFLGFGKEKEKKVKKTKALPNKKINQTKLQKILNALNRPLSDFFKYKSKDSKPIQIWQGKSFALNDIITPSTFIGGGENSTEPLLTNIYSIPGLEIAQHQTDLSPGLDTTQFLELLNPSNALLNNNQIIGDALANQSQEPLSSLFENLRLSSSQPLSLFENSSVDTKLPVEEASILYGSDVCPTDFGTNGESASGKELPGSTTFPGAKAPIVPLTNVDTGGNNLANPTSIVRSSIVDVIDQVSSIDPTDIFEVNINDLKNADISVLSGEISVDYLMPSGQFLGSQVFSRGNHTLQPPTGVTGDVIVKIHNKGDTPGTYILNGFESKAVEPFNINLEFEGGLTGEQQEIIRAAAKSVEAIITQGLPTAIVDGKLIDDVNFKISSTNLDGAGGTAARTKIDFMRFGTMLPVQSITQFDAADIAELESTGELFSVVQHELLHGLGFGNLWEAKGLVDYAGTPLAQYNGKEAVQAFQELGGLTSNIALENEGEGSAGLHWNENLLQDELMTADYNNGKGGKAPISTVTIASLADLGYEVNLNRATPDFGLFGSQKPKQEDLTPEQIEAFRQLAETSFVNSNEEFIYATMPEVDPNTVAPEIWAHAERFFKNGEYYEWRQILIGDWRAGHTISDYVWKYMTHPSKLDHRSAGAKANDKDYWHFISNRNGFPDPNWIVKGNMAWIPEWKPNYEREMEQERQRREAEFQQRQEEEARIRREQEEQFKREQERVRKEEEARRLEAEAKQRELEEQERRLRQEMERRRQEEERRKELERIRELERQAEIARQQGKGGLDWFVAKPLPEFGPVDPFETKLTGETVGNLVPDDYYRFTLSRPGRIDARLMRLLADADLVLYDVRNRPISYSMREGITDEQILVDLIPGTYMLRVNSPKGVTTDYNLVVQFKHKLSESELGPPAGWRPGGGKGGRSGSGSGGSGGGAPLFADPRIKRIYDTALNNFVIPERAKANARIQQLEREKQSYQQELRQLLDQMNGEQRAKVYRALDGIRDERRAWVDSVANPIKSGIDRTADWIIDQIEGKIPAQAYNTPWLGDQLRSAKDSFKGAVNGARSWLKGKVDWVQAGVKDAIWQFTEVLKNAYRTGAEINGAIESAAQQLKQTIDKLVGNINNWVGEFKGKVLDSVQWLRNVGVDIPSVGWGWLKTPGFKWNFYDSVVEPLANSIANGVQSSVNSVGDFAKGTVDWIKPRAQSAVAAVVDAIFGDKTGHLYNKIHNVDQQIEATKTGLERAINNQAAFYKRLLDDFIRGLGEAGNFVIGALMGEFNEEASIWQTLLDSAIGMIPIVGEIGDVRDLIAYTKRFVEKPEEMQDPWNWVGVAGSLIGLVPVIGGAIKGVTKVARNADFIKEIKKLGPSVVEAIVDFVKKTDWSALAAKSKNFFDKISDVTEGFLRKLNDGIRAFKDLLPKLGILQPSYAGISKLPDEGFFAKIADNIRQLRREAPSKIGEGFSWLKGKLDNLASSVGDVTKVVSQKIDNFLKDAELTGETNKAKNYQKSGGFEKANKEFDEITQGLEIKSQGSGIRSAEFEDGTTISVRPNSTDNQPTIQINRPNDDKHIKVRYD